MPPLRHSQNCRRHKQREFLDAYFDPTKGIGYTLGRTNIHSCDFSSGSYTYVDEGDKELKSFSVDHDRQFRIPFIKQALAAAGGKLTLFVQPLESAGIHEDQQRHAARWETEAGVLPVVGQLLHEVHQGVRAGRHPDLGHHRPERADGDADVGVVHLLRRRRARLSEELPRPDDEDGKGWATRRSSPGTTTATSSISESAPSSPTPRPRSTCGASVSTGTSHGAAATRCSTTSGSCTRRSRQAPDLHRRLRRFLQGRKISATGDWAKSTAAR